MRNDWMTALSRRHYHSAGKRTIPSANESALKFKIPNTDVKELHFIKVAKRHSDDGVYNVYYSITVCVCVCAFVKLLLTPLGGGDGRASGIYKIDKSNTAVWKETRRGTERASRKGGISACRTTSSALLS